MSASPLTPLDYIAAGYWQDFLAGRSIAGGMAYETELQRCKLDASETTQRTVSWAFSPVCGEHCLRALRFGRAGFALAWLLAQL